MAPARSEEWLFRGQEGDRRCVAVAQRLLAVVQEWRVEVALAWTRVVGVKTEGREQSGATRYRNQKDLGVRRRTPPTFTRPRLDGSNAEGQPDEAEGASTFIPSVADRWS